MGGESPVVELYDSNGNALSVQNGSAIPASTPALMIAGSDGTNSRYILVDSSGRPVMVGAGTAGSPSGGVVSIQGVASGTVVPISGTISATQNGNIDAGNSSTTPLAGSGTFSGTGIDVSVYGVVSVFVFTDQAGTLNLEWSINGTNWDDVNSYTVSASTALSIQFGPQARFFRVVYQNGSSAQGTFRLQTIERPITAFPETVPASYTIQNSDNVLLTKTVQGTSPWVENITQFGGSNVVTGTGASGAGIPRVTVSNDSNILATQSGSWTVTANQGTPNTLANKWPVQVTDGTNTMPTGDAVGRAIFEKITDGTNTAAVKAASTAAVATDPALVVAISPNNTVAVTQSTSPWVANITQFGGNNVVTGTGASGVGIPRVTVSNDSNILATQSGTWTVAQGAPNSNANKWPVQVTDGTHNMPTMDAIARAGFQEITDGTNGPVAVKAASTVPVVADPALVVVISPNQQAIPVTEAPSTATTGVSFGRTIVGTSNTLTAIRATTYTEQTTNFTGSVKSSSANDASAGTGARTVIITYYDQTGAGPNTETVTLNGTTAVNLVNTNHCFIEKMVVVTVGSGGSNAGTISLFTGSAGTGTTVGSIGVATLATGRGDNTTLWCHHYTPASKTTSIYLINGGTTGNQNADFSLYSIPVLTANAAEVKVSDSVVSAANSDSVVRSSASPIKITGFARTTMYVVSNGSNQPYNGGFDYSDQ